MAQIDFISSVSGIKEGVVLEKGVKLNEDYLNDNFQQICDLLDYFIDYPDLFIDIITPEEEGFHLFFYQRIFLRAIMRYKTVFVTAPRAWSKSFLIILGMILQCIFIPGRKCFICAPGKSQGSKIAREKIVEIYSHWPLIRKEVKLPKGCDPDFPGKFSADEVKLEFKNGSVLDVVAPLNTTLGGRRHGGLLDELRDHEEEATNRIVLPLLNVSRRLPDGTINPKEPNRQRIYATSATSKVSFAYGVLMDVFQKAIIDPEDYFCMGCDYRVPMLHGLLQKSFIVDLKTEASFNEVSFSTEYLSLWQGANENSWFSFDRLVCHRKLKNPEWHAKNLVGTRFYYLFSVDVGRIHDQTVCTIFRVNISEQGTHYASIVNIVVLGREAKTKTFFQQAIDLKRLIERFNPREVVIDTNGLGIGLGEEMTREQFDKEECKTYPPYGFFNDDVFKKTQPRDCPMILYSMKANATLKPKVQSNAYTRITSGRVKFLISEQEARTALLATKKGAKMKPEQRVARLMPHEMTSRLFDEMMNFRVKKTQGAQEFAIEQINARYPDDKFYSLCYGLWRIKEIEDEETSKKRKRHIDPHQLLFFN